MGRIGIHLFLASLKKNLQMRMEYFQKFKHSDLNNGS